MSFLKRFQVTLESLHSLPAGANYVVAYSGGVDSHVLLHCCKSLALPVRAVHVHHGLQSIADDWVSHCNNICSASGIPLEVVYVDAQPKPGQSPEEAAREARYGALKQNLSDGDCLLTAQHLDDQAETILLQLFRTAGTAGLAAMPVRREFAGFLHLRPLITFSRESIEAFARQQQLHWIEDPSNQDISFDRNFIRTKLMPLLENRWSGISEQLSTVARLQASNLQVLNDMAAIDLADAIRYPLIRSKVSAFDVVSVLSISVLKQLSTPRLLNVLRHWINESIETKGEKLSPTRNLLEEIEKALLHTKVDANPVISFSEFEFRKYQDNLYLLKPVDQASGENIPLAGSWQPSSPLRSSSLNVQLKVVEKIGEGLQLDLLGQTLNISYRKGGERFHPANRRHSRSLKKLLQEAGVPPWDRGSIPLLYLKDELIAVPGLWVCRRYAVDADETGWQVEIEKIV